MAGRCEPSLCSTHTLCPSWNPADCSVIRADATARDGGAPHPQGVKHAAASVWDQVTKSAPLPSAGSSLAWIVRVVDSLCPFQFCSETVNEVTLPFASRLTLSTNATWPVASPAPMTPPRSTIREPWDGSLDTGRPASFALAVHTWALPLAMAARS